MRYKESRKFYNTTRGVVLLAILTFNLSFGFGLAHAQEKGKVQELTGRIEPGEVLLYSLPDLQQGQRLYIHLSGVSGNLDPIMGLVDGEFDPETLEAEFEAALDRATTEGLDPLEVIEETRDRFALAWDDDSGGGLSAALEFEIPRNGDYRLIISGALTAFGGQTFGDYHLVIGLDSPQVISGQAEPTGDEIAVLDVEATPPGAGVQELTGSLTGDKPSTFFTLNDLKPGDTLYVYIEATSGDLRPSIVLNNFAHKPIRSANLDGNNSETSLQYTFPIEARNYQLEIFGCCGAERTTTGEYRLLVGVNAPEVLTAQAKPGGRVIVRQPIEVQIGLKLEQIIEVDQQSEFFTAVASLRMEWLDPTLAFNPESCQCDLKSFTASNFNQFLEIAEGRWPEYTLRNQQGNRWIQNRVVVIYSDGHAIYFERFTTNFQVDFDFRKYPFDTQQFVIQIDSLYPEEYLTYTQLEGFSEISTGHGEDEFILTGFETSINHNQVTSSGAISSRFNFIFEGPRHLNYYIFQIFVPILLIILVSWVTFFLRDYGRRIEVASANLLLFIAFSFSLSENYPRLGYLTFLDALMAVMFVVNALVVAYNVWLKRLELNGQGELADRIDTILDWVYPITYLLLLGGIVWWFFR